MYDGKFSSSFYFSQSPSRYNLSITAVTNNLPCYILQMKYQFLPCFHRVSGRMEIDQNELKMVLPDSLVDCGWLRKSGERERIGKRMLKLAEIRSEKGKKPNSPPKKKSQQTNLLKNPSHPSCISRERN